MAVTLMDAPTLPLFPVTLASALSEAAALLASAGLPSPALDAQVLLMHATGLTREKCIADPDKLLDKNEIEAYRFAVARRQRHEPVAYIIGQKEFWSLDFYVTRDTLIPRPESETLVEAALRKAQNLTIQEQKPGLGQPQLETVQPLAAYDRTAQHKPHTSIALLDVGTGSGSLLVALLRELPHAAGTAVDHSEPALRVAERNARRHGVTDRAQFICSHWCDAITDRTFDLIVSNPPYIALRDADALMPDVAQYEPHTALFAGSDGLDAYRMLVPQVAERLNAGGWALFEVGNGQGAEVAAMLRVQGLVEVETMNDLAGVQRCVAARKPVCALSAMPV